MESLKHFVLAINLVSLSTSTHAFKPDIVRGCRTIAQAQKNVSSPDAIHAAYCLGVIDGIITARSKQQFPVPLPDPCFYKALVPPKELAEQIVRVLTEKPEILELSRRVANDPGAIAAYFALGLENKCNSPGKISK